uniref:ATP synthase CF0 subunit I n=1 Tax=Astrosyne radiata TaxID=1158023 RepID=A0A2U9NT60_9STRA|nr:ATP synthase CF0 subunit I [Astrosyne radiata]AWT40317.1 ATP synthase CF0 subunit I [Astrosyne radiata]
MNNIIPLNLNILETGLINILLLIGILVYGYVTILYSTINKNKDQILDELTMIKNNILTVLKKLKTYIINMNHGYQFIFVQLYIEINKKLEQDIINNLYLNLTAIKFNYKITKLRLKEAVKENLFNTRHQLIKLTLEKMIDSLKSDISSSRKLFELNFNIADTFRKIKKEGDYVQSN